MRSASFPLQLSAALTTINVQDCRLAIARAAEGVGYFGFAELCREALGPAGLSSVTKM